MSRENKSKKIDIKYLAELAGVSISTVSRVLNRSPGASEKTIKKVSELAKKAGYYPDSIAKGLRLKKTYTIGVIFNDIQNPFYSDILWSINEKLHQVNYSMLVSYSNWDADREKENIMNFLSQKVDGIIMTPCRETSSNLQILVDKEIETVFVDSFSNYKNISYSCSNHKRASYLGTEHLIKYGHKDILLVSAMPLTSFSRLFIKGYKQALSDYKIKLNKDLIIPLNNMTIENCCDTFKAIISNKEITFTGIMITSDFLAMCLYMILNELDFKIPQDYSIIGYDDIIIASALYPPLTTIHQSRKEIGYTAVRILLNNIENKKNRIVQKAVIEPYLIERDSVKKIN